ncbi:monooxygenase [Thiosulfatimonas sediminis]|uniref:Monooxygenase n=1 Tax=Thiosulfatimonas sediminis TaxID=2675054 RepID=A0A6F8PUB6_9GAMM|nr:LLM class flavin-dependent oxidoreductase [Thiosulfatimonas sediminis]BBP45598.1 monooxygenase [Thiosulfatimonas sediminis]
MRSKPIQLGAMLHITPQLGQSAAQTYQSFTDLVQDLDHLGFDHAWVTEHHFNDMSLTPAPTQIMGHLLAKTERIQVGAAALLVGFHNPIAVAEQLAVLDRLYPRRVLCGFAKGGPFESQNSAFKADKDLSRSRMLEALPAMLELWQEQGACTHHGEHFQWQQLNLQPNAEITAQQLFVASGDAQTIAMAVQNGLGLMAAQFWDFDKIQQQITLYKRHAETYFSKPKPPRMMAARGLFMDRNAAVAKQQALEHIRSFREQKAKHWGKAPGPMAKLQPEEMLERMLCGTPEEVMDKVIHLLHNGVTDLVLNPLTQNHCLRTEQLHWFYNEIWQNLPNHTFAKSMAS